MVTPEDEDIIRRGKAIYDEKLRALLDPTHRGQYLSIEPDTGQYFIGKTPEEAMKKALVAFPNRLTYGVCIGYDVSATMGGGWSYPAFERPWSPGR